MKIYTSYFAKVRLLEENGIVPIAICLKSPYYYRGLEYKKLAPSYEILMEYKKNNDEEYYKYNFNKDILELLNPNLTVNELFILSGGRDVALICYEKLGFCHRHLVANWITRNTKFIVEEWMDRRQAICPIFFTNIDSQ